MYYIYRLAFRLFGFSRFQTNGMLLLLPTLMVVVFSDSIFRLVHSPQHQFSNDRQMLDSLIARWHETDVPVDQVTFTAQPVDLQLATAEELTSIGLPRPLAQRVVQYRSKGGKFWSINDLLKIYGMDSSLFLEVKDRIIIRQNERPEHKAEKLPPDQKQVKRQHHALRFDINEADTTSLKSVYGIGSRLSQRIVRYREALGGFVSLDQLSEVYGLDSVTVQRLIEVVFIAKEFAPKKINASTADENMLAGHPYIKHQAARAIVTYRFQHGHFTSIDDLKGIKKLEQINWEKLTPYLTF